MGRDKKRITVNIRSRNPEDQESQLRMIKDTFGRTSSRELSINMPRDDHSGSSSKGQVVPNEPLETDIAKNVNQKLDRKLDTLRHKGIDPTVSRLASAEERVATRSRLKGFTKWCGDKFGGATVVIVVRAGWEAAKGKIGL